MLIVFNDFPHKRASLSKGVVKSWLGSGEVVKSCRRGGIWLVATATTEKKHNKQLGSVQCQAKISSKIWSTIKELFAYHGLTW